VEAIKLFQNRTAAIADGFQQRFLLEKACPANISAMFGFLRVSSYDCQVMVREQYLQLVDWDYIWGQMEMSPHSFWLSVG
jgi:hypothetical protein